jgi:O-antigen ligase
VTFQRVLLAAIVLALAWGVLAFGAVYPWAYTTLAIACAVVGGVGLITGRDRRAASTRLAIGLMAIAFVITLQLVPLPRRALTSLSPATDTFLSQSDFSYMRPTNNAEPSDFVDPSSLPWRPISIDPAKTVLGLGLFGALALFLLGATRTISNVGARPLAMAVMFLGILITVLAIIQLAINPNAREFTLIYGFWRPRYVSTPFGPFVNPNHYAGWMLMALPLVLGLGYGTFERARLEAPPGTSHPGRFALAEAGGVVALCAFAFLVMGVSLVMTRSRSGIACLAIATALPGAMIARRQPSSRARASVVAAFALLLLGIVAWAGVDNMIVKFRAAQVGPVSRLGAWRDTLHIIADSPLTGTGFDTYGRAMQLYQTPPRTVYFLEAHNDYLQILAEGGLLVGLPVLVAVLIFAGDVQRRFKEAPKTGLTYWLRVGAVVGLVSVAVQSLVEFSLQMPGNAAFFAVLAAIALHRSPRLTPKFKPTP